MRPIDADAFKKYIDAQEGRLFIGCTVGEAMKILIDEQPTIQLEPQEGHWIPVHPIQSDDPGAYMCSKCKTGMWEIRPSAYHYCPHCGAKMDGGEKK